MVKPQPTVAQNTWSFLRDTMITPTGFRKDDAR
jgi:phosphomannomutase/phosphoglucomutase